MKYNLLGFVYRRFCIQLCRLKHAERLRIYWNVLRRHIESVLYLFTQHLNKNPALRIWKNFTIQNQMTSFSWSVLTGIEKKNRLILYIRAYYINYQPLLQVTTHTDTIWLNPKHIICFCLIFVVVNYRASRGIDFSNVNHVVLFDYPRDPSEYVRRVGRTARGAGGTGRAFIFAVGKQVSLARRIIQRNQKGHPLHDVPSAYELESSIF